MSTSRKLRVATVITRFNGGAGQVALNGALALPDGEYERAIVTGGVGMDSVASNGEARATRDTVLYGDEAVENAAAGDLTPAAHAAGMEIVQVGPLVPQEADQLVAAADAMGVARVGRQQRLEAGRLRAERRESHLREQMIDRAFGGFGDGEDA